ncbi:hypothetical protein GCM10023322_01470 [Rugosimonospora acidiphila]|uniref:Uncharacterized protein n=1 Tax=Rugosimonospora acidiphila TaxID=556531 RepID=A0ABP9RH29_9ACTN
MSRGAPDPREWPRVAGREAAQQVGLFRMLDGYTLPPTPRLARPWCDGPRIAPLA